MAFGRSGPLEIELIQPVSGEGPHQEFLDAGNEGMHHVRFRVDDLDARVAELEAELVAMRQREGELLGEIERLRGKLPMNRLKRALGVRPPD